MGPFGEFFRSSRAPLGAGGGKDGAKLYRLMDYARDRTLRNVTLPLICDVHLAMTVPTINAFLWFTPLSKCKLVN